MTETAVLPLPPVPDTGEQSSGSNVEKNTTESGADRVFQAARKPSRARAMKAKCKDCFGRYTDGRHDCMVRRCPLYLWMPYREQEPDLSWDAQRPATEREQAARTKGGELMRARRSTP